MMIIYLTHTTCTQSGVPHATSDINNDVEVDKYPVTSFHDATIRDMAQISVSDQRYDLLGGYTDTTIDEFFARPVVIHTDTWTHGSTYSASIDPWNLWATDAAVAAKLANFWLARGTPKLTLRMTGNPFHMGRLTVAYCPYRAHALNHVTVGTSPNTFALSQMPGTRECPLAPNKSPKFEMDLPFFYRYPNVDVSNFADIGKLFLEADQALATANGVAVDVSIHITLSMQDFAAYIPHATSAAVNSTSVVEEVDMDHNTKDTLEAIPNSVSFKTQDNSELKEDGVVSSVTSALQQASSALRDVPVIGQFATPLSDAFGMGTQIAKLFGLSRPPIMTAPSFYRNVPFSNNANVAGPEAVQKLSFDPKQSLTIDPSVYNLQGEDQMSLAYIRQTWTHLTTFAWPTTSAAGTSLFQINVTPAYFFKLTTATPEDVIKLSSIYMGVMPFQYWRGAIEFKIVFLSSQYHSGYMTITYQPNNNTHTPLLTNRQISRIVDLHETDETQFTVGWAQPEPFKEIAAVTAKTDQYGLSPVTYNSDQCNGQLQFSVFNQLRAPTAADVNVMVFVRAAPDFRAFGTAQADYAAMNSLPVGTAAQIDAMTFVGEIEDANKMASTSLMHAGENVLSLRTLLKRVELLKILETSGVGGLTTLTTFFLGGYPCFFGPPITGQTGQWGATNNINNLTWLNIYRQCYAGWNGTLRHKVAVSSVKTESGVHYDNVIEAFRAPNVMDTVGWQNVLTTAAVADGPLIGFGFNNLKGGSYGKIGSVATVGVNQSVLEVDVPSYTNAKFYGTGFFAFNTNNRDENQTHVGCRLFSKDNVSTPSSSTVATCFHYVSAGEDFNLLFYLGGAEFVLPP